MKYDVLIRATVEFSGDIEDLEDAVALGLFDPDHVVLQPRVDDGNEQFEVLDYHECEVREHDSQALYLETHPNFGGKTDDEE